jgi:hypothetical protein
MGFDSAWITDHLVSPRPDWVRDRFLEGWTLLAALATTTERMCVGTLITSITLHNPAVLARQATTVDHISDGIPAHTDRSASGLSPSTPIPGTPSSIPTSAPWRP